MSAIDYECVGDSGALASGLQAGWRQRRAISANQWGKVVA